MAAKIIRRDVSAVTIQVTIPLDSNMLEGERTVQKCVNEVGCLATEELLCRFDTDGSPLSVAGTSLTSKGQVDKCYQTSFGEVCVPRHVYQSSKGGSTFCPLDRDARIIGTSTPLFAKIVSSKYSETGASRVVTDLDENHGRKVARSYVQSISEAVAAGAEAKEDTWSYVEPELDDAVSTVTVGLDGTCMLMCEGGYRQAMVGTIALYNNKGERLHTLYTACAPEYGKQTFLKKFEAEINAAKTRHATARFIGVADGAADNWTFLEQHTEGQILDFWHVTQYLSKAAESLYHGKGKLAQRSQWLEEACHNLKHKQRSAAKLLKEMEEGVGLKMPKTQKENLQSAVTYFRNHKHQMKYAQALSRNEPIGSGVTEAACKVIVKQRLGGSGMKWKTSGAAAVLTLRTMNKSSGKWGQFWKKVGQYGLAA